MDPLLEEVLPDLTNPGVALGIARTAIRKDDEDTGLKHKLWLTCVVKDGAVWYRPFAAARSWLAANPRWLEKATGREGGEWRPLNEVLAGLDQDQAKLDVLVGTAPDAGSSTAGFGAPGPGFGGWH